MCSMVNLVLKLQWNMVSVFLLSNWFVLPVVRALVPRMTLDDLFEQKGEVAKSVLEELEKVTGILFDYAVFLW